MLYIFLKTDEYHTEYVPILYNCFHMCANPVEKLFIDNSHFPTWCIFLTVQYGSHSKSLLRSHFSSKVHDVFVHDDKPFHQHEFIAVTIKNHSKSETDIYREKDWVNMVASPWT